MNTMGLFLLAGGYLAHLLLAKCSLVVCPPLAFCSLSLKKALPGVDALLTMFTTFILATVDGAKLEG